jgi:hypothetical protein
MWFALGAASVLSATIAFVPGVSARQGTWNQPLVSTSVNGKLERVDDSLNGIIIKTDAGERLAWQLPAPVIAEASKYKPGDSVWVIYRQLAASERAVTALGFPAAKDSMPKYVNATGAPVLLRTSAAVDGKCDAPGAEQRQANEYPLLLQGVAEDPAACWCCATRGQTCPPVNRSGPGRIVLAACFP